MIISRSGSLIAALDDMVKHQSASVPDSVSTDVLSWSFTGRCHCHAASSFLSLAYAAASTGYGDADTRDVHFGTSSVARGAFAPDKQGSYSGAGGYGAYGSYQEPREGIIAVNLEPDWVSGPAPAPSGPSNAPFPASDVAVSLDWTCLCDSVSTWQAGNVLIGGCFDHAYQHVSHAAEHACLQQGHSWLSLHCDETMVRC